MADWVGRAETTNRNPARKPVVERRRAGLAAHDAWRIA